MWNSRTVRAVVLAVDRTETVRCYKEVAGASQVDLEVPGSHGIDDLELWSLRAGVQYTQGWMSVPPCRGSVPSQHTALHPHVTP